MYPCDFVAAFVFIDLTADRSMVIALESIIILAIFSTMLADFLLWVTFDIEMTVRSSH